MKKIEITAINNLMFELDKIKTIEEFKAFLEVTVEFLTEIAQMRNFTDMKQVRELVIKGTKLIDEITLITFNASSSSTIDIENELMCPKCGTRDTQPTPGCGCRALGGNHIMEYHHKCKDNI